MSPCWSGADACPAYSIGTIGGEQCQFCPAGKVGPTDVNGDPIRGWKSAQSYVCGACEPGKYRAEQQQTDTCVDCPTGRYSSSGQGACSICDEDRFEDSNTRCERCPEGRGPTGFVANVTSATSCAMCNASTYSPSGMCIECLEPNVVNEARTTCNRPFECPAGSECVDAAGCGDENSGLTQCSACLAGSVSASGQRCVACTEPGKRANDDQTACESCGAGRQPSPDNATCAACSDLPGAKFSMFGIECQECEGETTTVDTDRTSCTSCTAGKEPNAAKTGCVDCNGNRYSTFGVCTECVQPNVVNEARTTCASCPAGKEPNLANTACIDCTGNRVSSSGFCEECPTHQVPCIGGLPCTNTSRIACMDCPDRQTGLDGQCVCAPGSYEPSSGRIACYEHEIDAVEPTSTQESCLPCGSCADCRGNSPVPTRGYVRLNPMNRDEIDLGQVVPVFKCKGAQGCFGVNTTAVTAHGCQAHYVGHFCETCADGYRMARLTNGHENFRCEKCPEADFAWVGSLVVLVGALVIITQTKRLIEKLVGKDPQVLVIMAVIRSAWQPMRTLITYMQVGTQVGPVLSIEFPPMFASITQRLSEYVELVDVFISAECAGLDGFHVKWLSQVVIMPVTLVCIVGGVFLFERSRFSVEEAGKLRVAREARAVATSHAFVNLFFVLFFCYPRVCTYSFGAWICRTVQLEPSQQSVLLADDRILCEDPTHRTFQYVSLLLIVIVAFGVPVGSAILQIRAKGRQAPISESSKMRLAEALKISLDRAEATIDAVTASTFGFLADAYKPSYFYWESIDMLRKFFIVGVVLVFPRGSVAQISMTLLVSNLFFAAHMHCWPYKVDLDNRLRAATELHVIMIVAVALNLRTNLDNEYAAELAKSPDDPDVVRNYEDNMQARLLWYDAFLLGSFVACVVVALMLTLLAKMRKVKWALAINHGGSDGDHFARLIAAHKRLELGLHSDYDLKLLGDFIGELDHNDHIRAGKRLWRNKRLVAHLGAAEMQALLDEMELRLPKSERLGYHFTDLDAARVIMEQSNGLRASSVGQLGGGVSICLASPIELGWEAHGNAGPSFTKKVGDELWGSKWYEVMPGEPWSDLEQQIRSGNLKGSWPDARDHWGTYHNKLEAVFVVRIPTKLDPARIVPGRENVFIAPIADCVPGEGKDNASYFSNQLIEACLVLKSPDSEHDRERLAAAGQKGQTNVEVQYLSDRDKFHGMTNVTLREELVSYDERLPDVLERIDMKARFGASRDHWCDATLGFSVNVASIHSLEQGATDAILRLHTQLQIENAGKQHWQEDIGRFKPAEMAAAIESIDQALPRAYTLAFYYTSVEEAETRSDSTGFSCGNTGELQVSLRSPTDLGWEQYGGGRWEDTAGSALWGPDWRRLHCDKLQAVVVLGVPTGYINTGSSQWFSIPKSLMMTRDDTRKAAEPRYASAHICKSYILNPRSGSGVRQHAKFEDELGNYMKPNDIGDDDARSLPSGWTERSHNGRAFYVNMVTGERTWVRPDNMGDDDARSLPSGWTERSHNGRAFYVNTVTGERTWVRPDNTGDDDARRLRKPPPLDRYVIRDLPSGWTERSHNGRAFYVNMVTGERTWVRPDDLGSVKTMVEANPLAQRPHDDDTVIAEVEI
eukprot:COSAG02_NODE_1761_length_11029_cov_46.691034_2_plen_1633_part_00